MRPAMTLASTPGNESSVSFGMPASGVGHVADEVRQGGAEPVGLGQVGAGLGAEDDRGPLAVERAVGVAGVGQGGRGHLEAQQLDGSMAASDRGGMP